MRNIFGYTSIFCRKSSWSWSFQLLSRALHTPLTGAQRTAVWRSNRQYRERPACVSCMRDSLSVRLLMERSRSGDRAKILRDLTASRPDVLVANRRKQNLAPNGQKIHSEQILQKRCKCLWQLAYWTVCLIERSKVAF